LAEFKPFGVVFFDIGGTLGTVTGSGSTRRLEPFASSANLLQTFSKVLGLRLGIITNIPDQMSTEDVRRMLATAGLLTLLNSALIITSRDAGASKPDVKIYEFAARRAGVPTNQCLYVGEDPAEVAGAQASGMGGLVKSVPSQ